MSPPEQLPLDRELSQRLAQAIDAEDQACWRNAYLCLARLDGAAVYVEGWAVTRGVAREHGWLELDGHIVDPTPAYLEDAPAVYFPGLRFTPQEARRTVETRSPTCEPGDFPLAWRWGWGGADAPEYRAAFDAAWAYIQQTGQVAQGEE